MGTEAVLHSPVPETPFTRAGDPNGGPVIKKRRGRPLGSKNKIKKNIPNTLLDLPKRDLSKEEPLDVPLQSQPNASANTGAQPINPGPLLPPQPLSVTVNDEPGTHANFDSEKTTDITKTQQKEQSGNAENQHPSSIQKDFIDVEGYNVGDNRTIFGWLFNTGHPMNFGPVRPLTDQNALGNAGWITQRKLTAHMDEQRVLTNNDLYIKNPPLYSVRGY